MEGNLKHTSSATLLVYLILLPCWICVGATNMSDTKKLHTKLFTDYNTDIRPVLEQKQAVQLNISFSLISLLSLDEVSGSLKFVGQFQLNWIDESMVWDPASYGDIRILSVSQGKVWMPELVLVTTTDVIQFVGKTENDFYKINFYSNGRAEFGPTERIESSCVVNVKHYPFDTQVCKVTFNAAGYHKNQLAMVLRKDTFDLKLYKGNAIWDLVGTKVENPKDFELTLEFQLKRQSTFIVINVLLPISFLGFLNVLVFLLVHESGERISYCITVLLAISVFMTITSDTLPKSSQPVPYISYKLMIDVIISMLITVVTILNLRLHHRDKEKKVPSCLKKIYLVLCCRLQKRKESDYSECTDEQSATNKDHHHGKSRQHYSPEREYPRNNSGQPSLVGGYYIRPGFPEYELTKRRGREIPKAKTEYVPRSEQKVTWKHIAAMVDAFAFIFFALAVISSFVVFMILASDT